MRFPAAFLLIPIVLAAGACKKSGSPGDEKAAPAQAESPAPEPEATATGESETPVVDRIAAAARDGDREKLRQHWPTEALVEVLEKRGILAEPDAAARSRAM